MEESLVDPKYEYEAPQFFDFKQQHNDDEFETDSWFANKPDDEGGIPILNPFETSSEQADMGKDERSEQETEKDKTSANTTTSVDEISNNPLSPNTTEEIKCEVDTLTDESKEAESTTDVDKEPVKGSINTTEELKSEVEFSNDSLDEGKGQETDLKTTENNTAAVVSKPKNIVTSWADWERSKPKQSTQNEEKTDTKMVTRAQKRNHTLNVSDSSCVPNKRKKEIKNISKSQSQKRPRSMSNNPERKPASLTVAVTPQCLKRQKTSKPTMIKLKTTEEMEMECIAKLRKKTKHQIEANKNTMKKAITATTYHPVRSVTDPTKPQEFHFQTDKRVKPHAMTTRADDTEKEFLNGLRKHPPSPTWKNRATIPKPFNFSDSTAKRKLVDGEDKPTDLHESVALQVYKFQTTTPPRFRTKKHGDNPAEERTSVEKVNKKLRATRPVTPHLTTSSRARPMSSEVLSREEQEKRDAEIIRNYKFKAKPFDSRIIECDGLYGVKKHHEPKQATTAVPFSFDSDERIEARKEKKVDTEQSEEQPAPFKAKPQPKFDKVFKPQLKHEKTAPKPFTFEEKDKERWQKKEEKIQEVYKQEDKLREFKAGLLPPDSPDTLPEVSSKSCTSFKPFNLNTENRGAVKAERWIQKVQSELEEERKKTKFQAKPSKVTQEMPFLPLKSHKPLTEVSAFALNTNRRAERWEELDTVKKEREEVDEEIRKEREEIRLKEEKEEIALLRKNLVHKAQPIHLFKEVVIKPSDRPLTAPESPAWSDVHRQRMDR